VQTSVVMVNPAGTGMPRLALATKG